MEQTEAGCGEKAAILVSAFEESFLAIRSTIHPSDLPGEIRGKSSNVSFAARKIFDIHRWNKNRGDVIITVIDCKHNTPTLAPLAALTIPVAIF